MNEKYTADLVTRHIEQKVERGDILSFVVNAKDPITGTIFDFQELQLNAQTLLYGLPSELWFMQCCFDGYDGYSDLICWLLPPQISTYISKVMRRSSRKVRVSR